MGRTTNDLKFDEIFERVASVTDIKSSGALAQTLGISSPSVSKQKMGNTFPAHWVVSIADKYNLDLNYLVFGVKESSKHDHPEEEFIEALVRYLQSKYPLSEVDQNSGEIKIMKGEIDNLIERLAKHLLT